MQKSYFNSIIIFFSLFFFSFSNSDNYQIECVSNETNGYTLLKIWDSKSGKRYKSEKARKDAIHAVLYSGIAGVNGCATQPALLVNAEVIEKFKKIEKEFFSSKGNWAKYTRSSATESTLPINLGQKNWKVYQVSVSKDALKKFLEEKSILKSINTGF
jgi:hypothetical protein